MRLFLQFVPEQAVVHQQRLTYAFRLFCAIYGHEALVDPIQARTADALLTYQVEKVRPTKHAVSLSNLYTPRSLRIPAPPPTPFQLEDERTVLFYAPEYGAMPDWLAEIFEWVSCADEYSVTARDAVGRVPFGNSYVGRHGLNVGRPYAAIAMHLLQRAICKIVPSCSPQPAFPTASCRHLIVNTHDVDFLPLDRMRSIKRLTKNAVISLVLGRSPLQCARQLGQAVNTAVTSRNALDQMPALVQGESERSVGASFYFITSNQHRRDSNYRLEEAHVEKLLQDLVTKGMEVGIHGSYTSFDAHGQLDCEFARLRQLGFDPKGGRQHWLRFTVSRLIQEVERAGAVYDASLGWVDQVGFRAGACFAFPPYNFESERSASFLEIPLVIMDQALQESEKTEEKRYDAAAAILAMSRRYGWGGISLLWHPNAFGGCQLSPDSGRIFWRLLDQRATWNDCWTSGVSFVSAIQERYRRVGLLTSGLQALCDAPMPVAGLPC
jgi:hypothetical protein